MNFLKTGDKGAPSCGLYIENQGTEKKGKQATAVRELKTGGKLGKKRTDHCKKQVHHALGQRALWAKKKSLGGDRIPSGKVITDFKKMSGPSG